MNLIFSALLSRDRMKTFFTRIKANDIALPGCRFLETLTPAWLAWRSLTPG
jgi:hypothetical protein